MKLLGIHFLIHFQLAIAPNEFSRAVKLKLIWHDCTAASYKLAPPTSFVLLMMMMMTIMMTMIAMMMTMMMVVMQSSHRLTSTHLIQYFLLLSVTSVFQLPESDGYSHK